MWIEILCIVISLAIALKIYYDRYVLKWSHFETTPMKRYTLIGNAPGLMKMTEEILKKSLHNWLEDSKSDSVLVWHGMQPTIFTRNHEVFKTILSNQKYIAKSDIYWIWEGLLGINTLFLSTGNEWKKRRKLLTPSVHFNHLSSYIPIIEKHATICCQRCKPTP